MRWVLCLLGVLVLSGCICGNSGYDVSTTTLPAIVCDPPYIRVGAGCCLDQNNNRICDSHEKNEEPSTTTLASASTTIQATKTTIPPTTTSQETTSTTVQQATTSTSPTATVPDTSTTTATTTTLSAVSTTTSTFMMLVPPTLVVQPLLCSSADPPECGGICPSGSNCEYIYEMKDIGGVQVPYMGCECQETTTTTLPPCRKVFDPVEGYKCMGSCSPGYVCTKIATSCGCIKLSI